MLAQSATNDWPAAVEILNEHRQSPFVLICEQRAWHAGVPLIGIRNDLIADPDGVEVWTRKLEDALRAVEQVS